MSVLECRELCVDRGRTHVLRGVDLAVAGGEMIGLLGSSGSGKSTLLSTIAGFIPPASGEVWLAGRQVSAPRRLVPPEQRRLGVVFQGTALWPHMTAAEIVAYPLRRDGLDRAVARAQAIELLARLGVEQLADRKPAQLSGGEQQRVSVARAFARGASVLLLDEPTAHLDAAHRHRLLDLLREIQAGSGVAVVHATHDVAEALAMADRLAILRGGVIVQAASPDAVYSEPIDVEVALLTGPASVLVGDLVIGSPGCAEVTAGGFRSTVTVSASARSGLGLNLLVRPEWASLGGPLSGVVRRAWYRGAHTDYRLATSTGEIEVRHPGPPVASAGENVTWRLARAWPLPSREGLADRKRT